MRRASATTLTAPFQPGNLSYPSGDLTGSLEYDLDHDLPRLHHRVPCIEEEPSQFAGCRKLEDPIRSSA